MENDLDLIGTGEGFLKKTISALLLRATISKWDLMKLKSLCKTKDTTIKTKKHPTEWENIFYQFRKKLSQFKNGVQAARFQMLQDLGNHQGLALSLRYSMSSFSTTWASSAHPPVSTFQAPESLSSWVASFPWTPSSGCCHNRLVTSTDTQVFAAAATATHS